ncbi:MAG: glycoside hydrolase family 31 protein [Kiritimatiellae bacterium]|nr:glycoside hydrolase family 31 protein [Kiritimatiellia bacterium]
MYFNKIHHPLNFLFAQKYLPAKKVLQIGKRAFQLNLTDLGDEVFQVAIQNRLWPRNLSQATLEKQLSDAPSRGSLSIGKTGIFTFTGPDGKPLLETEPGRGFGVSGQAWMLKFIYSPAMRFYGMGEKNIGFELSHQRTKFWNTDLWADFHFHKIVHEHCDPLYISIPYVVIKQGKRYAGILLDNPHAAFMATNPRLRIADQSEADEKPEDDFYLGSADGMPSVYFIGGPTLADVTSRMQRLCGTTPRPPLWALGHHQCRWGYRNFADLERLANAYEKHKIPCSALWLDIDYMRGFRVFTFNDAHFADPLKQFETLLQRGFRVVPILDPGVKMDEKFEVYRDGLRANAFCENPEGTPYVGFVWPGATVFPDFSIEKARQWWAKHVARFAERSIHGVWIDMNDPSTGASESDEMLFGHGKHPHHTFHNQYALGMAKATREGLLKARPEARPFVLSRSAFISMSRHAAVWNGDNYSNEHHLWQSIPVSLNLSLSGIPFNGPDVPGFGGNADAALAETWYQAGFLFLFFRNHSAIGTTDQEPCAFGEKPMRVIREFIRLRYKLLPTIYNLFLEQERCGQPIMRPMLYHFENTPALSLDYVGDQFLLGPDILHAPFLNHSGEPRNVALPKGYWYDLFAEEWLTGDRTIQVNRRAPDQTPLFIRHGALIPMAAVVPDHDLPKLSDIELHAFFAPGIPAKSVCAYEWDDGETFAYREGHFSRMEFRASAGKKGITIEYETTHIGCGDLAWRLVPRGNDTPIKLVRQGAKG